MKWQIWAKWPLLGVAAAAVVVAAPSDQYGADTAKPAKSQHIAPAQPQQSAPAPQAATQGTQRLQAEQAAGRVELERLKPGRSEPAAAKKTTIANAFTPTSWYVPPPPPPPPPPQPPPKPTAPPLPFTYLGRYDDPPRVVVILSSGDRLYTVSEGEMIDGNYRVEHVADGAVDILYLPLNINQSLPVSTNQSLGMGQSISVGAK